MLGTSLAGLRVLDFSHVVAGPLCGMLLGDLGAEVVKIESPEGEMGRRIGPPWIHGESVISLSVNRNKQGLAVDLKTPQGRNLVRRLMASADVVIESFRPGVMKRFGLDFDSVRDANPSLVYCSISAYGQHGPSSGKAGVDGIIQAVAGLMSTLGPAGSPPSKVPSPIADMATGYLATIAILGALVPVRQGLKGQHIDVSLYNATVMLQQVGLASFLASGIEPGQSGSAAPYAAPNEAFPTADGWIMVAAYQPERWSALCHAIGQPALEKDPLFADNVSRVGHRDALFQQLAAAFQQRPTEAWLSTLEAVDILCAPIAGYAEVTSSLQYRSSGVETVIEHPIAGPVRMPGFAIGNPGGDGARATPPPLVGQHSAAVLAAYGIPDEEIDALLRCGAIATPATPITPSRSITA
jgi:crotonobetainyl-CoA:carnitine CoA-transferase CaiB-like acyl-CoA transferase